MPFRKRMKGLRVENLIAKGTMEHDHKAMSEFQWDCVTRLNATIQLEQETYLAQHPELMAMLTCLLGDLCNKSRKKEILKDAALHFTRPEEIIDKEIREFLNVPPNKPYNYSEEEVPELNVSNLDEDLVEIVFRHYPQLCLVPPPTVYSTPNTMSSSFASVVTSQTTLPTPEPIPTPEPTTSELFYKLVSNTVDKAIYSRVTDELVTYDTAYVELMKAVEEAMEIPVIEIKEDIAELFYNAYNMFEFLLDEKARVAAEIAWEKRMRKKLKRTLRRQKNFKGYETPPSGSDSSSHPSYKEPMPRPCKCHPQFRYNRYPKDRFGIYLPRPQKFSDRNLTTTPNISMEELTEPEEDIDTKSAASAKTSEKSSTKKKTVTVKSH
ncbi:uncharacterized protein LOC142986090 [Anticarsia gemmatalis]|uniref:uncharacterized protein LOC142986090 n=1 Tax=Anticarsia gemmatalis TaxID=129554 RepID=UPI003F766E77